MSDIKRKDKLKKCAEKGIIICQDFILEDSFSDGISIRSGSMTKFLGVMTLDFLESPVEALREAYEKKAFLHVIEIILHKKHNDNYRVVLHVKNPEVMSIETSLYSDFSYLIFAKDFLNKLSSNLSKSKIKFKIKSKELE